MSTRSTQAQLSRVHTELRHGMGLEHHNEKARLKFLQGINPTRDQPSPTSYTTVHRIHDKRQTSDYGFHQTENKEAN